jgi:DNA-binding response OmpR family regulator
MSQDPESSTFDPRFSERILVADEDVYSAHDLTIGLSRLGHDVVHVVSAGELIGALRPETTQNVILSATLPDIGPEAMCRRLRSFSATVRIIVCLPTQDELDTVLCLEAGADDCVGRPYRPREVLARFNAIGRRQLPEPATRHPPLVHAATNSSAADLTMSPRGTTTPTRTPLECHGVRVDVHRREVRVDEVTVDLTRKEFDLLALLIEHRSFVVSRELIADRVWNGTWSRRTIDTHVASLRSKLDRPTLIHTVRGIGFKLSA